MNKILVTGGCGYIGSHTLVDLIDHGFDVISVDNLCNATEKSLDGIYKINGKRVKNYQVDLTNERELAHVFSENKDIIGVIHFAALKAVGESVEKPLLYYKNNLIGLLNILDNMARFSIPNLIFSSSCSVYGNTSVLPVTELTLKQEAESPYGRTKQMGEDILMDLAKTDSQIATILLRYFNPAGAHESAFIGESPANPASNLVPVITEAAANKRPPLTVFGTDYPTRDGSCIRDYIHVMDLANAHTLALQYLLENKKEEKCTVFNLGIGKGVSVLEALSAFEQETKVKAPFILGERRPGDVVEIYADFHKAAEKLGWEPKRSIGDIMRTAWEWEKVKNQ